MVGKKSDKLGKTALTGPIIHTKVLTTLYINHHFYNHTDGSNLWLPLQGPLVLSLVIGQKSTSKPT